MPQAHSARRRCIPPVAAMIEALDCLDTCAVDCLIAIGGGSTTGPSKALAYGTGLPQIIIPTTDAGSEATSIPGQTEDWIKITLSVPKVLPAVILYHPELVVTLPAAMTVTSGLNAMAHAAEPPYAPDRNAARHLRPFRQRLHPHVCRGRSC
ncbi:MAG: iron-containing alcohol dehydrogenase [Rhodobacterales bacterium]|nr:iron-containing alcohol dehydrogenase [Rhodobacterales bacterium]